MIKSNADFLQVLADRARAAAGDDTFHRPEDLTPTPGWLDGLNGKARVVAGQGLKPAYCLTDEAIWRRYAAVSARRLFAFDDVVAVERSETLAVQAAAGALSELEPTRTLDAEVRLGDGSAVALEAAGHWLATFLERCVR